MYRLKCQIQAYSLVLWVVDLDVPSRLGKLNENTQTQTNESTESIYDIELKKALSNSNTHGISESLVYSGVHVLTTFVRAPYRVLSELLSFQKWGCEQVSSEDCQQRLDELILEHGDAHESVVRQRKLVGVLEKMERLALAMNVEVEFCYGADVSVK